MSNLIAILVVLALLVFFPAFLFILLVRAIRISGMRWWGIVILLSLLTCYCTTMTAVIGLIVGGNATGAAALEKRYCGEFREALTRTETLPAVLERMDAAAESDEYQIREPDKNLRFRYVWLLGGCFLFAGANLMMFAPGRRERRHPADCIVMIVAALVVFLTGIWQIAWGNGYAYQAASYRRFLTGWHEGIRLDAIRASNLEIAVQLTERGVKNLNELRRMFRELSGEKMLGVPAGNKKAGVDGSGIAIIGGADGPTAVFINSELMKKQNGAPADGNKEETDSETENAESDL
jgi:hypothetical protein